MNEVKLHGQRQMGLQVVLKLFFGSEEQHLEKMSWTVKFWKNRLME